MLHTALGVLQRENVRSRKLSETQKRELRDARLAMLKFWGVLSLVTLPWLVGAAGCVAISSDMQWWVVAILGFGPLAIMLATGAVGSALLAKRKRLLEAACTAVPPLAPGEPARCHVCGGPLQIDPHEYIDVCGFCQADNIVAPQMLARVQGRQALVVDAYAQAVGHEALALGEQSGCLGFAAFGMAALAPLISIVLFVGVVIALQTSGRGPYPVTYLAYAGSVGTCLGTLERASDGSYFADFGVGQPFGFSRQLRAEPTTPGERLRAEQLVGRRVHASTGIGLVKRVYGAPLAEGSNLAEIVLADGTTANESLQGLCFAEGTASTRKLAQLGSDGRGLLLRNGELLYAGPSSVEAISSGGEVRTLMSIWRLAAIAGHGNEVYACDDSALFRVEGQPLPAEMTRPELRFPKAPVAIAVDARFIYVAFPEVVEVFTRAGRSERTLSVANVAHLAADGEALYGAAPDRIVKISSSDWNETTLVRVSGEQPVQVLAQHRSHVYWADSRALHRVQKSGGSPAKILDVDLVTDVGFHDGVACLARATSRSSDAAGGAIVCLDARTSKPKNLAPRARGASKLVVSAGVVYWIDALDGLYVTTR